MFSTKVIYAIEVLTELSKATPNRLGKRVIKKGYIENECVMDSTISSYVFSTLCKYEYIDRLSTGYALTKDLRDITLYEIVILFHNGIIIGEVLNSMDCRGNYIWDPEFAKLVIYEKVLNAELITRFKAVRIADLVGQTV